MRLYDPLEMELPDLGLRRRCRTPRPASSSFVDTHDRGFRKRFAGRGRTSARRAARRRSQRAGVDALELATDDDLVDAILRFADLRKRRSQLATGGGRAAAAAR